ncbi:Hint domain-containing protein [Acidimangrovimonas pyrenivorans]|uniref:Hint domain-containing protein n=1 Tax=Acidimangrovimonas pyrenivorans TaxID=2030798 RepID=A0ABV7AEA5_9RHOB
MTDRTDDQHGCHDHHPTRDGIVSGTTGNDKIDLYYTGDPDGDRIDHGDALLPGQGPDDDIVHAGAGDDTIIGGAGNDEIHGEDGNDMATGSDGDDSVYGEDGNDSLWGWNGDDSVDGGDGNDQLHGGTGDDTLVGGAGNDTLEGGDDNDKLEGGAGDDSLDGGAGDDSLCGGAGDDTIDGGDGNDLAFGGDGSDVMTGGAGNDTLVGGNDSDTIDGGSGNDVIYGDGGDCADNSVTITFEGDVSAAYLNSIGVYEIDPSTGAIGNVQMAWENASAQGSGGDLQPGVSSYTFTVTPGAQVGLFMVSDGDSQNNYDALGSGELSFVNASGDPATIHDSNPQLVFNGADGTTTDINGGVFHSAGYGSDVDLNSDGDQHLQDYGQDADGSLHIGIEDMVNLGDHDFNDAMLKVQVGDGVGFSNPFHDITGTVQTDDGAQAGDSLNGGEGDDTIFGGSGDDTITGGDGHDSLSGGDDRDLFIGGNGGDFVDGGEGGVDCDTLDLTGTGPLHINYDPSNHENGTVNFLDHDGNTTGTLTFKNIENVIPCFTPGTLIATPKGERLVEELRPGDTVITRDNGIQEIRWVGQKALDWKALSANPHLKPVLIRAGALGNGLPERDMMVSPNHRLLVANDRTALYFDEHEVLVAAKHVVNNMGIQTIESIGTTYIHFMFDRHEVVLSNGAWTESFQPGDFTLKGMGNAQRSEIFELFPELRTPEGVEDYTAARKTLKRHEAMLLAK